MAESLFFLNSFLDRSASLPGNVRKNLHLIRELDECAVGALLPMCCSLLSARCVAWTGRCGSVC